MPFSATISQRNPTCVSGRIRDEKTGREYSAALHIASGRVVLRHADAWHRLIPANSLPAVRYAFTLAARADVS